MKGRVWGEVREKTFFGKRMVCLVDAGPEWDCRDLPEGLVVYGPEQDIPQTPRRIASPQSCRVQHVGCAKNR